MSEKEFSYPTELKKLRACLDCHLIKTYDQFKKEGCDNCSFQKTEIVDKITKNFNGIIAITNPKKSWAAKYLSKSKNNNSFYNL